MFKKIILIPPCETYGDCFSVVGLIYYLLDYYENVYFCLGNPSIESYFRHYFIFENRILFTSDVDATLSDGEFGEYHICNLHSGGWKEADFRYYQHPNINPIYYFNDMNVLYNQLPIQDEYRCKDVINLPLKSLQVNHIVYYNLIGLNNSVRMDYFNYTRNIQKELEVKQQILDKNNIDDKYSIINCPFPEETMHGVSNYKTINISGISETSGYLLSLIEGAESLHLIESLNTNFIYHCHYKNILKYDKNIYLHDWARHRHWNQINLDYSWKMFDNPRLDNWNFIFNRDEIFNYPDR